MGFPNHVGHLREPEGLLPDGGLYRPIGRKPRQTGEPWHPSCHGGKTPAKSHVPLCPCAHSAQFGIKGHCPLREPWHPSCRGG